MADTKGEVREMIARWLEDEPNRCIDPNCSRCLHAVEFAEEIRSDKWNGRRLRTGPVAMKAPEKLDIPGSLISWALERQLRDPRSEVDKFLAWHRTKGSKSKDWLENLKLWLLKQKEFDDARPNKNPPKRQQVAPVQRMSLEDRQKLLRGTPTNGTGQ